MVRHNMKTADIAREVGISEGAMKNKLMRRNEFKLSEIRKIMRIFPGLSWEYLFEDKDAR